MLRPAPAAVLSSLVCTALAQGPADLFCVDHPRSVFDNLSGQSEPPAIADFDGDGVPDVAFAGPTLQWGTGTRFLSGPQLGHSPLAAVHMMPSPLAFDCDGDGDQDLLQFD